MSDGDQWLKWSARSEGLPSPSLPVTLPSLPSPLFPPALPFPLPLPFTFPSP